MENFLFPTHSTVRKRKRNLVPEYPNPLSSVPSSLLLLFLGHTHTVAITHQKPDPYIRWPEIRARNLLSVKTVANANTLYLGIWYLNLPVKTVFWIANRLSPARNSSVSLKLGIGAQVALSEQGAAAAVWSSKLSNATNPILQVLDLGNLVVRDADDSNVDKYLWQSFDYPTDTLLPGQKLGWDKKSGVDRYLTSWKSSLDPGRLHFPNRPDPRPGYLRFKRHNPENTPNRAVGGPAVQRDTADEHQPSSQLHLSRQPGRRSVLRVKRGGPHHEVPVDNGPHWDPAAVHVRRGRLETVLVQTERPMRRIHGVRALWGV